MIVADTNLVAYLILRGEFTSVARQVRLRDCIWMAPPSFRYEVLSVLWDHLRANHLTRDQAIFAAKRAEKLVEVSDFRPDPAEVFNLALRSNCSTYDIQFVALAIHLDVPLVTADQKLIRAFPDIATDLRQFIQVR